mgnify:FL=1
MELKPHDFGSQHGQDERVLALLSNRRHEPRYFIDLAANKPESLSNTVQLEHEGWSGLCIDASAHSAARFGASKRTCTFVRALVGDTSTPRSHALLFRDVVPGPSSTLAWTDGLSSVVSSAHQPFCWAAGKCVPPNLARARHGVRLVHTRMPVRTLGQLLDDTHAPRTIDYMSLDVRARSPSKSSDLTGSSNP